MNEDRDAVLQAVSSAVLAVTRHLSVREVLQVIVRSAGQLLDARYAALGVPDEEGAFAEFVAEGISAEEWEAIGPTPRQHGMLGAMLREGAPVRLPDIRRDARFEYWPRAHPVLKDFLGVPVLDGDEVLGILFLSNKRTPGGFTEADQRLLTMFAAHAAIALTNARLYERGRELALVEERTRMARELHDAVTQKLFSLRLTAQAAASLVPRDPARALAEIERVERLAGEALAELRAVIVELRPAELGRHGLAETLRKHVRLLDRLHPASFTFDESPVCALEPATEVVVLRVAQEALHNASRHSAARAVGVWLGCRGDRVILEVRDDGAGFDVTAATGRGLGIPSMQDRAQALGGSVSVTSEPGRGTLVRMEVPT
ncbi:GAF domain-containing sensor histidine kinase [Streptosporangium sp. NBC_01639]|uniref:GAF domain-containing sensor histidine kinase n=1 Tax=unclassified Streptosporangium TaxID=2632669 RepID=UPI002DD97DFD|nr:GAF domain-containing sensor histidine kinase [Streptosporangium sp. NBC_01756]WSC82990.1 GAF domain-containing sensor histidine kinase [Streptosporangium sp. NBC_01756]WTD58460.1 GAF domain-containing sensor histidine kinase [Streptosporangium sp. NBC_01639]